MILMIIMNLIIVQIILLLFFHNAFILVVYYMNTIFVLQNLFSFSLSLFFCCLFISLLISFSHTAVSFKLSTDFRQTFEKKKVKEPLSCAFSCC